MEKLRVRNEVPILDSMRAFAALSVCFYHFICTTTGYFKNDLLLSIFSIGEYGVQLFFVISGFIIPWSMHHAGFTIKNFFSFFLKRLARLEPPYIFSLLLALGILFVRDHFLGKENDHVVVSAKQVALHLGYLIPWFEGYQWLNLVYWTLSVEFQYYLFMALMFVPLTRSALWGRLIIYASIISASNIGTGAFLPYWLPVFFLGILLFMYKASFISKGEYFITSGVVLIFCLIKYPLASVFYAVLPIVFVLYYEKGRIFGLDLLGKFSYSLYLIHPLLGASLINILSHRFTDPVSKFFVVFGGFCFTLLSAWLMYIFVEKPSKKLSSSVKYNTKRS